MSRLAAALVGLVAWFTTGRQRRAKLLALLGLVLVVVAVAGALEPEASPQLTVDEERPQGNTLVALQGYGHGGRVVEINPAGEVVWTYDDGDDFFDVEVLGPDRRQLAIADEIPDEQCPPRFQDDGFSNCVRNSLRIVDRETTETTWEYAWFDVKLHEHELHDADHYTVDGADRWVLVDMGNDRVFAVDRSGEIVWQWNATDTYDRPSGMGPEGDWTHANDVDRLEPGVFQVSLRNFDTVVELHIADDGSVTVQPVVGPNQFAGQGGLLFEQHNPDRLADDYLLVADSEHDRVIEIDTRSRDVLWTWGGSAVLDWPRDADRLSNGHTLIADSYNDRVVEVDEGGEIVWAVHTGRLPYEVDRIPADWASDHREGSQARPTAEEADLPGQIREVNPIVEAFNYSRSVAKYVFPAGIARRVLLLVSGVVALLFAGGEGVRSWRRSVRNDEEYDPFHDNSISKVDD